MEDPVVESIKKKLEIFSHEKKRLRKEKSNSRNSIQAQVRFFLAVAFRMKKSNSSLTPCIGILTTEK